MEIDSWNVEFLVFINEFRVEFYVGVLCTGLDSFKCHNKGFNLIDLELKLGVLRWLNVTVCSLVFDRLDLKGERHSISAYCFTSNVM
jgi:hypothetical protein